MDEKFFDSITTNQEFLYHYTNMPALIGILQNNELWSIIIGSYDKNEETERSLKLLLKETGYSDVKIEQSSLTMR